MIFTKLTDKNQLKDSCNYVIVVSGIYAPLHGILLAKWASWGEFYSSAGFAIGREYVTHFCEARVNDIEEIRKGAPPMERNKDYLLDLIKSASNTIGFQGGKFDETILKDIQSYINEYQLL